MAISTIVASLAFFIAMIALWMTSDVIKRVESQNEKFLHAHLKGLRTDMKKITMSVGDLKSEMIPLHKSSQTTDQRFSDHTKAIDHVNAQLARLIADIDTLDRSIPKRYRTTVTKQHDNGQESVSQ